MKNKLVADGITRERLLLKFLSFHKYTTPAMVKILLKLTTNGTYVFLRRMEAKKLINAGYFEIGLVRHKVIGISINGLHAVANYRYQELAEDASDEEKDRVLDVDESKAFKPANFSYSRLEHTLAIQKTHIMIVRKAIPELKQFGSMQATDNKTHASNLKGKKKTKKPKANNLPDMLFTSDKGLVALETEISAKSSERYTSILFAHVKAIDAGKYDHVCYVIDENSRSIAHKIKKRMKALMISDKLFTFVHCDLSIEKLARSKMRETM